MGISNPPQQAVKLKGNMKTSIKTLLAVLLLATACAAQTPTVLANNEAPRPSINSVTTSGTLGTTTYYYWVVATYAGGNSAPAGPLATSSSNATLSSTNYNIIAFTAPSSPLSAVTGYDLLRTTTPNVPSGACACAVSTAQAASPLNDQSNTLSAYTVSTLANVTVSVVGDPITTSGVSLAKVLINGLTASAVGNVASNVNFVQLNNSATGNAISVAAAGTDTNIGLTVASKGTGAINLMTGGVSGRVGAIINNVASSVNGVSISPGITTAGPTITAGGTGSDTNAPINIQGKGTGAIFLNDGTDPTKQIKVVASAMTAGAIHTITSAATTARTLTIPDATMTVSGATATDCGTSAGACSTTTISTTLKLVSGTAAATSASPSTVAITGMPAFTSTATYKCGASNATTVANVFSVLTAGYVSTTAVTFTGPNTLTDTIRWWCIGYAHQQPKSVAYLY